jgi:hypothetical protein
MSEENKPKPIDIENINLELMKLKVTDMPSLLEYAHTVGGFKIVPTNEGHIKSHARDVMLQQTDEQLAIIFEQMKVMAKQVQEIKKRVYISDLIYNVEITFQPVVGKRYFLYEMQNEKRFLSLISPKEWGAKIADKKYLAEIQLNSDHTWKVIDSVDFLEP